jgi:penicillin-binding protein 2
MIGNPLSSDSPGPALPELQRRLRWVAVIGVGALALLVGRLWQLQFMRGEGYYERTVSNVVKERYLPAVRGQLLDSKRIPLALNRPAFNVYVTPKLLTPEVTRELVRMLGLDDDEVSKLQERVAVGAKHDRKAPVLVLEDQGRDRAALLEQARTRLRGVEVRHEPFRYYPQGELAATLVGYMTQMTAAESDRLQAKGYDPSDLVGRAGLESAWENYLRGKRGVERFAVDARGERLDDKTAEQLIQGDRVIDPVPGANLILTIDSELQQLAELAVGGAAAAVVVVEPKTGRIRAMVSKPSFDPNTMTGHLTKAEYALLMSDPRKPFIDKVTRATYPPGSVYKFTTAFAALEDGQASEDEPMFCTGEYRLGGTRFRCHGTHEKVNLLGAIQHSCDTYFWRLAERVGLDRISDIARDFGFGAPTNLGLGGDSAGRIPTRAWYESRGRYQIGYATNASIGQGDVEVTVLQMAMAYAAIANGGTLFVPQVVERVESYDGRLIVAYEPKVARKVNVSGRSVDIWNRGMWKVTNQAGGTAYDHGYIENLTMVGKTGTAEVEKNHVPDPDQARDRWDPNAAHAWFAGWAPVEDPEIAIVVLVEHGGAGGQVAWPIARQITAGYFTSIHPRDPAPRDRPEHKKSARRRRNADTADGASATGEL